MSLARIGAHSAAQHGQLGRKPERRTWAGLIEPGLPRVVSSRKCRRPTRRTCTATGSRTPRARVAARRSPGRIGAHSLIGAQLSSKTCPPDHVVVYGSSQRSGFAIRRHLHNTMSEDPDLKKKERKRRDFARGERSRTRSTPRLQLETTRSLFLLRQTLGPRALQIRSWGPWHQCPPRRLRRATRRAC